VLPLAARVGEAQVDVFDVIVLDGLQDFFGGRHEYLFGWSSQGGRVRAAAGYL
jgi:hypothetical protein